jgi:hypothetical protein
VSVLPATESCAGFRDKSTDKSKLPSSITTGAGGCAGITVGGPHRCGCAGIRAAAVTVWAVNIDRPAMGCRGCIRDDERRRIHSSGSSLNVHRTPFKERLPVFYAQVLQSLNSRRSSAPKDVSLPHDVGQILFARNPKNRITNGCRKRRAGSPANNARTLLHVCAPYGARGGERKCNEKPGNRVHGAAFHQRALAKASKKHVSRNRRLSADVL